MSRETMKLGLWKELLEAGWEYMGLNCLYKYLSVRCGRMRFRMNFRDDRILQVEANRTTTELEKQETGRSSVWEVLDQGTYQTAKINEEGWISFSSEKKRKEPKQSKKKRSS